MAEIDDVLWQETKENLMEIHGDSDVVEDILSNLEGEGFFDIPDDFVNFDYEDDEFSPW